MWRPTPMSDRHFPRGCRSLVIDAGNGGVVTHEAEIVSAVRMIPDYGDPNLIGTAYLGARHELTRMVSDQLVRAGMVADVEDYELTILVTARVKAWPAVAGLTVSEVSMTDDAS